MTFEEATDETFDGLLSEAGVVVVHFTAPWCAPCETVEHHLRELAAGSKGLRLVRLDIDAHLDVPARLGVLSLPTVILFEGREERARIVGAQPRRRYEGALAPYLA